MEPSELAKLTLYQAMCCHWLSQPMADCLSRDYLAWLDYFRAHRN